MSEIEEWEAFKESHRMDLPKIEHRPQIFPEGRRDFALLTGGIAISYVAVGIPIEKAVIFAGITTGVLYGPKKLIQAYFRR